MNKNQLLEQVNKKYKLLTEQASYSNILLEAKQAKTEADYRQISEKMLFTGQNIKGILNSTFDKETANRIAEDLITHFIVGLK
jgi:hypothetical protein